MLLSENHKFNFLNLCIERFADKNGMVVKLLSRIKHQALSLEDENH